MIDFGNLRCVLQLESVALVSKPRATPMRRATGMRAVDPQLSFGVWEHSWEQVDNDRSDYPGRDEKETPRIALIGNDFWQGLIKSEVVQLTAKPRFVGSIPTGASRSAV